MTNRDLTLLSVLDTLNQHVSIRQYTDERISDETLRLILNAARRSPTSSNVQAYSFIVVRDPVIKQQLAVLAGQQKHIETCPVFVAVCADITRVRAACAIHGEVLAQNLENTLVATIDAALAGMSLSSAAESLGMGTVMIGGMRNHPEEVAELLGLPNGAFVVFGMCIGYVDRHERPAQKPRLPEQLIIHHERYQAQDVARALHEHDAELAAHYRRDGRTSPDAAWTGAMAEKFSKPQRPRLRAVLEKLGFKFE
jgi:FMN reductase (NADPH)